MVKRSLNPKNSRDIVTQPVRRAQLPRLTDPLWDTCNSKGENVAHPIVRLLSEYLMGPA